MSSMVEEWKVEEHEMLIHTPMQDVEGRQNSRTGHFDLPGTPGDVPPVLPADAMFVADLP